MMFGLCNRPGLPGKWPTLFPRDEEPELLCIGITEWPIQTVTLDRAIRAAGGFLYLDD